MTPETLALARDLALVLLIVEAIILGLPLLIIPFYAIRYLRRLKAPIRPNLRKVRRRTAQVEKVTKAAMAIAVQPFLWARATGAGVRRACGYLARRR
ncbi:MAG: hypothetical protein CEE40_07790 [Chloroflexi bacterium B3_Chlor]|nr:MAG: hypothetical protein CEE40_07790 [Chloroflexi bacterium B3_Chlor]